MNFRNILPKIYGVLILVGLLTMGTLVRKNQYYIGAQRFDADDQNYEEFKKPIFKDITSQSGIDHVHIRPLVDEVIYRRIDSFFVSPGLAIADYNGDGYQDVFIPSTSPNMANILYLNQKNKTFKNVAAEWGIEWNKAGNLAAATATAFDANEDGKPDLLLTGMGCTHFWINEGDKFSLKQDSGLMDCKNALAGIPYDLNQDGKLDIYMLRYWGPHDMFVLKTPYIYVNNLYNADNGGINNVFINKGNGVFADETKSWGGDDGHWSYDAAFVDMNDDGVTDLYISNDYGPDQLYEIRGNKLVHTDRFEVPDRRYGMNASLGDLDDDYKPSLFVSNAYEGPPYGLTGNFLWKMDKDLAVDTAMKKNVMKCGFAWGASFVDWNVDGWVDLYVANGFISTKINQEKEIPRYLEKEANIYNALQIRTLPGELSSDIRNWVAFTKDNGLHRGQRDCLFMNYKNKFMVDMAEHHGMDQLRGDNRAVGVLDMDNDGDLDFVLTSRNVPTTVWENIVNPNADKWIGVTLKAHTGHASGTGARVTIKQGESQQTRWNTGGRNGFLASSDIRNHFGLRESGPVDVTVKWANGKVSTWKSLAPGKYHLLEEQTNANQLP